MVCLQHEFLFLHWYVVFGDVFVVLMPVTNFFFQSLITMFKSSELIWSPLLAIPHRNAYLHVLVNIML